MWNKEYKRMQSGVKFEEDCCPLKSLMRQYHLILCKTATLNFVKNEGVRRQRGIVLACRL